MIPKHSIAGNANQLRMGLGLRHEEIIKDIVDLSKQAGYEYMEESFGTKFSKFSGFSQCLGPNAYMIGFNSDHFWSVAFHRFTIAHELGHLSMPHHRQLLDGGVLHRSQTERFRYGDNIEREADYFAVCFLAPAQEFQNKSRRLNYDMESIFNLADHFGISPYSAVLRFIELTDLSCSLVVSNTDGAIDYEWPSKNMRDAYGYRSLKDEPVPPNTLTADYIHGNTTVDTCTISLNDWFEDLDVEIGATESVIGLGYNGKILTLLTPDISDLDNYLSERYT